MSVWECVAAVFSHFSKTEVAAELCRATDVSMKTLFRNKLQASPMCRGIDFDCALIAVKLEFCFTDVNSSLRSF